MVPNGTSCNRPERERWLKGLRPTDLAQGALDVSITAVLRCGLPLTRRSQGAQSLYTSLQLLIIRHASQLKKEPPMNTIHGSGPII